MRIGAIDVGTNSIHLLVADIAADGQIRPVDMQRIQVMLGSGGLGAHRIMPDAFARGVQALVQLKAACESLSVVEVYATATSAVREASNGPDFCKAVKDATGIHVRIISGADEARLIWLGVRSTLDFSHGSVVLFDLGGGSTEIIHGDADEIRVALSTHLGHIRLSDAYLRAERLTDAERNAIKRHVRAELAPVFERIPPGSFGTLVGTSGTVRSLARMAAAARTGALPDHEQGLVLTRKELDRLIDRFVETPRAELERLPGMDVRRRDTLAAGAILVREIMKGLGAQTLTTSERSLRDGLICDWMVRHRPELDLERRIQHPRERSVLLAMQRFGADEAHARAVATMATRLFDGTARLHQLAAFDRELLRDAALLHDIGHHVAGENHPEHGQYLLKHIRMYGFTAPEMAIISNLVRYHSRGRPKQKHRDFAGMSKADQRRVRVLAGILQVADALDRSHNQPVERVDVELGSGRVRVRAVIRPGFDGDLERWEAEQRTRLLADALALPVTVETVGAP